MSSFNIRPASVYDAASIVEIRLGAVTQEEISEFGVTEDNLYSSLEKLRKKWDKDNLLEDGFEVFVSEDRGKITGFVVFNMKDNDNIDNIIVAKEEQGKGIGRALVEYVEELAKSRGFNFLKTETTENDKGVPWRAYGFWIKMGYKDSGVRIPTEYSFKDIPLVKRLT